MSPDVSEKLFIACDHAGVEVKNRLMQELGTKNDWVDLGTHSAESVNYPDYAMQVAQQILAHPHSRGILFVEAVLACLLWLISFKGFAQHFATQKKLGGLLLSTIMLMCCA